MKNSSLNRVDLVAESERYKVCDLKDNHDTLVLKLSPGSKKYIDNYLILNGLLSSKPGGPVCWGRV